MNLRHPLFSGNTVLDFIEPGNHCSKMQLWQAARTSNRLAKLAMPCMRRRLYSIKDRCLLRLWQGGNLQEATDRDRYPGLLSVNLKGRNEKLHTHEGWLFSSSGGRAA